MFTRRVVHNHSSFSIIPTPRFPHIDQYTPTSRIRRLLSAHHAYFPHTTPTSRTPRLLPAHRAPFAMHVLSTIDTHIVHGTSTLTHCTLYTVRRTLHTVRRTLHTVRRTLHTIRRTLHTVRRTLYGNSQYIGDVIYNIILIITTTIQEQSMQTGNVNISRR